MIVSQIAIEGKLWQLVKEYADDQYCLELLRFLGRHPSTQFSQAVIAHALNSRKLHIESALKRLTDKGIVRTHVGNNILLYSLTDNEPLRSPVFDLAKLEWYQWQLLLRQTGSTTTESSNSRTKNTNALELLP